MTDLALSALRGTTTVQKSGIICPVKQQHYNCTKGWELHIQCTAAVKLYNCTVIQHSMHFTTLCTEQQKGDANNKGVKKNVGKKSMERKLKGEEE